MDGLVLNTRCLHSVRSVNPAPLPQRSGKHQAALSKHHGGPATDSPRSACQYMRMLCCTQRAHAPVTESHHVAAVATFIRCIALRQLSGMQGVATRWMGMPAVMQRVDTPASARLRVIAILVEPTRLSWGRAGRLEWSSDGAVAAPGRTKNHNLQRCYRPLPRGQMRHVRMTRWAAGSVVRFGYGRKAVINQVRTPATQQVPSPANCPVGVPEAGTL